MISVRLKYAYGGETVKRHFDGLPLARSRGLAADDPAVAAVAADAGVASAPAC